MTLDTDHTRSWECEGGDGLVLGTQELLTSERTLTIQRKRTWDREDGLVGRKHHVGSQGIWCLSLFVLLLRQGCGRLVCFFSSQGFQGFLFRLLEVFSGKERVGTVCSLTLTCGALHNGDRGCEDMEATLMWMK